MYTYTGHDKTQIFYFAIYCPPPKKSTNTQFFPNALLSMHFLNWEIDMWSFCVRGMQRNWKIKHEIVFWRKLPLHQVKKLNPIEQCSCLAYYGLPLSQYLFWRFAVASISRFLFFLIERFNFDIPNNFQSFSSNWIGEWDMRLFRIIQTIWMK